MKNAQTEIEKYIREFDGGTPTEQRFAKELAASRDSIKAADGRREVLLDKALAEVRKLESNKRDIKALIIGRSYRELAKVFTAMLDNFEGVVSEASDVNNGIANTAKSLKPRE